MVTGGPLGSAGSRLPWLHALAAWGTSGTWSRGMHFSNDRRDRPERADVGSVDELAHGLCVSGADSFAVERRRGWRESPETPRRAPDDMWDERRGDGVEMIKHDPTGAGSVLRVRGHAAAFRGGAGGSSRALYRLEEDRRVMALGGVQWAEWSSDGQLLVATDDGRIQAREGGTAVTWEYDLSGAKPDPRPAPEDAHRW